MPNATYNDHTIDENNKAIKKKVSSKKTTDASKQAEVEALKAEHADALAICQDKLMRAHAEMDNLRKRAQQDVEKAHKYGIENFAKSLLPIVDSLEQAIEHQQAGEGVELTLKMFQDTLVKFNIQPIDPLHEPFDPKLHEAMTMQPNPAVEPNTVLQVIQKGYTLHQRLIRPALVIVSKG